MSDKPLNEIYLFQLVKAANQFKKRATDHLKKAGVNITSDQWILIKVVNENKGINQRELAKKVFKEPASVTRILDIIESKGWVERRNVANNRRVYELYTTEAGIALVKKALPLALELRSKGSKGISKEELTQLSSMLNKIFENFS